jgi:hypothetical protein
MGAGMVDLERVARGLFRPATSRLFRTLPQLDLPGFKNLEGLHIGMFLSAVRGIEGMRCTAGTCV